MNFEFTTEQQMLRDTLARYLSQHWDFAARRRALQSMPTGPTALWRGLAEDLGLMGAAFSLEAGGLGGGAVETMLIMEQLGKALAVEPFLPTVVIAGGLFKRLAGEPAQALIGDIVAGRMVVAFAHSEQSTRFRLDHVQTRAVRQGDAWRVSGRKSVVLGAPMATHYLTTARTQDGDVTLLLIPAQAAGVSREDFAAIDGQPASNISFDSAQALRLLGHDADGPALLEAVVDEAIVALGGESIGIMRELIDRTVTYLGQRQQFGQPLSSFQALQHRLADMAIQFEQALSMTYMATLALAGDDADARRSAVSAMKIQLTQALRFIGQQAVQLHGGIGMTDELEIGHYFKRALVIMSSFGSEDDHYRRYDKLNYSRTSAKAIGSNN